MEDLIQISQTACGLAVTEEDDVDDELKQIEPSGSYAQFSSYCTIRQLPVFTSRQLYSACSSTQLLIRLPRQPCDPVHFLVE